MSLQIKKVIKGKGKSVQEIADKMGISRVGLSQHINGNPSVEVLKRIADAIGVDISELFEQPASDVINCPYCGGKIKVSKE
jgi:transcriptional regulator with XRE-family HTH domain